MSLNLNTIGRARKMKVQKIESIPKPHVDTIVESLCDMLDDNSLRNLGNGTWEYLGHIYQTASLLTVLKPDCTICYTPIEFSDSHNVMSLTKCCKQIMHWSCLSNCASCPFCRCADFISPSFSLDKLNK